jgi:hypothetical protein
MLDWLLDNWITALMALTGLKRRNPALNTGFFVSAGGLEPPTLCLKGKCSTPELRAHQ